MIYEILNRSWVGAQFPASSIGCRPRKFRQHTSRPTSSQLYSKKLLMRMVSQLTRRLTQVKTNQIVELCCIKNDKKNWIRLASTSDCLSVIFWLKYSLSKFEKCMHIHSVILFVLSKCVPGITRVWQSHASICFMLLYACLCSSVCHHLLPLPVCRHVWWLWSWFYHVSGWALDGHHREETDLWQVRQWGKSSVSLNLQTNASIIIWSVKQLLYSWYKAL